MLVKRIYIITRNACIYDERMFVWIIVNILTYCVSKGYILDVDFDKLTFINSI